MLFVSPIATHNKYVVSVCVHDNGMSVEGRGNEHNNNCNKHMPAVCCIRISFNVDSMKVINNAPVDDDADDGKGGKREGKWGSGCRWGSCNDIVCGIIISRSSGMRLNNNTHTMRPATLRCV